MSSTPQTISWIAEQAGVGVETIRYYERRGLIEQPRRHDGGYRHYGEDEARRVRFIKQAQQVGFTLKEIAELLDLRDDPDATCEDVRERTMKVLRGIETKIARLARMRTALQGLAEDCPRQAPIASCTILSAFVEEPKKKG